jgi:hypothetical protein
MIIYGVCVVRNECDVIADSLQWAARFCRKIWVWDLGSTDGTWNAIQKLNMPQIIPLRKEPMPFINTMRGLVYAEAKVGIEEGAWIYIVDADEFFVGDPKPLLAAAEQEGAGIVGAWQVNFLPTKQDNATLQQQGEDKWAATPLHERLRHYRVEWFEHRFVHVVPGFTWDTSGLYSILRDDRGKKLRLSRRFGFVRHYRYRSPSQVVRRYGTRQGRDGIPARRISASPGRSCNGRGWSGYGRASSITSREGSAEALAHDSFRRHVLSTQPAL